MIQKVKTIQRGKGALLVEWYTESSEGVRDQLKRGWLPYGAVDADQNVDETVLKKAVPYGMPFEKVLPKITIQPALIANALRANGLWTAEDIAHNPNAVTKALLACLGLSASKLQTFVREYNSKNEGA